MAKGRKGTTKESERHMSHGHPPPAPPPAGWFRLSNHAVERAREVGRTAFCVYVALARHADANGRCYPSCQRMADMLNVHKNTVGRAVLRLEEAGWIDVDRINGARNHYQLLPIGGIPSGGGVSAQPTPPMVPVSKAQPTPLVVPTDTTGDTPPPPPALRTDTTSGVLRKTKKEDQEGRPKKDKARRKAAAELAEIPTGLDTGAFRQKWGEWIKYRIAIRKTLTRQTADGQLKKLAEWGEAAAVAAIENSITQGWQGLFLPKEDRNGRQRTNTGSDPGTAGRGHL